MNEKNQNLLIKPNRKSTEKPYNDKYNVNTNQKGAQQKLRDDEKLMMTFFTNMICT